MSDPTIEAVETYLDRKARAKCPNGRTDKGKWNPKEDEVQSCCSSIRAPSRAYPWSLLSHCCSKEHLEKLYKIPAGSIATALKKENLPLLINSESVAVQDYLKKHLLKETNHATKQ